MLDVTLIRSASVVIKLTQEVNRHFNSANVWISMSLCYSASLSPGQNRHAVISAALSARLYHHNSGAPSLVTRDT